MPEDRAIVENRAELLAYEPNVVSKMALRLAWLGV